MPVQRDQHRAAEADDGRTDARRGRLQSGHSSFLAGLRGRCDRTGAALIFDEVMTTRRHPGGMQGAPGIRPDLTTLGKWIGGGLPCGAFGERTDIIALFDPGRAWPVPHVGTFNNNVLAMQAGTAAFDVYTPQAAERLNAISVDVQAPCSLSGYGAVLNLHCTVAHADSEQQLIDLVFFDLVAVSFHIARRGLIALNLAQSDAHFDAFETAFHSILAARRPLWHGAIQRAGL
ncbi:MAG: aminotransferase class III-fold pyridoxal phosphate-dependent enzyme [Paracoccaceae bacterium]